MCLFICGFATAQTLRKQWITMPEYIADTDKVQPDWTKSQKWQDWVVSKINRNDFGKPNQMVWPVYSDRANNETYKEPNAFSGIHSRLEFMEKLKVAEVKQGFALVYKTDEKSLDISTTAECKGWISVKNLLLWEECLRTRNKIYEKALIVHNPMKHGSPAEKNPPFYMEPDKNAETNPNQRAKDLEIYFVMKTVDVGNTKYYLLSTNMVIKDKTQTVYGWMPGEYITEWNQRLLLEPTYASKAVDYYKSKNINPSVFDYNDQDGARQLWTNEAMGNPFWQYYDFSYKRMHEHITRFPIISKASGDIHQVAAISSLSSHKSDPELLKEMEQLKQAKDNINVIFVVDATSSMKPYFQSVANALSEMMKKESTYPMKTGVVLYDAHSTEPKKLTPKINEISSFLTLEQEFIGMSDAGDYTSMFRGLETALDTRRMGYDKSHSNFIILIGNAGNYRTDPDGVQWKDHVAKLSQTMCDNRINFLAYQVHNAGSDAYNDWANQIGKLQNELAKKYQEKTTTGVLEYKLQTNRLYVMSRKGKGSSDELPFYVSYKYADSGQSETMEGLQNLINGNISDFQEHVKKKLTIFETNYINTTGESGYFVEQQLKEALLFEDWSEANVNTYMAHLKAGGVAKFIGHAPVRTDKAPAQYQLFDYVLFFTQYELQEVMRQLDKINSSEVVSNAKAFQDAIVKMGLAMLGQINEEDIWGMDMDKLLGQIYGIDVPLKICDLDIKKIPYYDKDYLKDYIDVFKRKLQNLQRINNDSNYNGRFQKNKNNYYWIPMDDMPGVYEDCSKIRINR